MRARGTARDQICERHSLQVQRDLSDLVGSGQIGGAELESAPHFEQNGSASSILATLGDLIVNTCMYVISKVSRAYLELKFPSLMLAAVCTILA